MMSNRKLSRKMFSCRKCFALLVVLSLLTNACCFQSGFFLMVKNNHRLNVNVLEEYLLQSTTDCFQRCFSNSHCKSVNIMSEMDALNITKLSKEILTGMFLIRHYGGRCLTLDTASNEFILSSACAEYFSYTSRGSPIHINSGKCMQPTSANSNSIIKAVADCNDNTKFSVTTRNTMRHHKTGKCIHPLNGSPYPYEGTQIVIYSGCEQKRLQMFIEERNFIKCQLLASIKDTSPNSYFAPEPYWSYYEPM